MLFCWKPESEVKRRSKRHRTQTVFLLARLQLEIDDRLLTTTLTSMWAAVLFSTLCKHTRTRVHHQHTQTHTHTNNKFNNCPHSDAPITVYPQPLANSSTSGAFLGTRWNIICGFDDVWFNAIALIKNASALVHDYHMSQRNACNHSWRAEMLLQLHHRTCQRFESLKVVFFFSCSTLQAAFVIRNLHTFSPRARKTDTFHKEGSYCL